MRQPIAAEILTETEHGCFEEVGLTDRITEHLGYILFKDGTGVYVQTMEGSTLVYCTVVSCGGQTLGMFYTDLAHAADYKDFVYGLSAKAMGIVREAKR